MKRITQGVRQGHVWNVYIVQRTAIALGSIAALVAASGAGTHWF